MANATINTKIKIDTSKLEKDVIERRLLSYGYMVEALAKQNCPVSPGGGRLRASISTNWSGSPSERQTADSVGRPPRSKHRFVVVVGSNVFYAPYVEFGTGMYAEGPGGSKAKRIPWLAPINGSFRWIKGIHPRAYLRKAFDEIKGLI